MGVYTDRRPKCLIRVGGTAILDISIERLRRVGCRNIVIVTGYQSKVIASHVESYPDVTCSLNERFATTNLLHSLMTLRERLDGPMYCTYGDTIVSDTVYQAVSVSDGDVVVAVDMDWSEYYKGRRQHPIEEAEKVLLDSAMSVARLGKHLETRNDVPLGEYAGLLRTSKTGTEQLVALFNEIDWSITPDSPFQSASFWRQACLTDLLQEYIERGNRVEAARISRGWIEVDTPEDLARLASLAEQQRVTGLIGDGIIS
jgi:choline kinase